METFNEALSLAQKGVGQIVGGAVIILAGALVSNINM